MAIDTATCETEMVESCCDGGRVTGPCSNKGTVIALKKVEEPPPKPDNHGPKKPVRKPKRYSISVECPRACLAFSQTMIEGSRNHVDDEWRQKTVSDLLSHAENHISLYMSGDTREEHLKHAQARITMALETALLRGMKT